MSQRKLRKKLNVYEEVENPIVASGLAEVKISHAYVQFFVNVDLCVVAVNLSTKPGIERTRRFDLRRALFI